MAWAEPPVVGAVYPILERDARDELGERLKNVDWAKYKDKLKQEAYDFKPPNLVDVKPASEDKTYYVDMSYTVNQDIVDGNGNVLYPKGFTFNPLDYVTMRATLVFISASDPNQVAWFKASQYSKDPSVKLLITDGSYSEMIKLLKRPVFYADHRIIDRFQIRGVPSVVKQDSTVMQVREYAIKRNN